jgi:hypothetical protein
MPTWRTTLGRALTPGRSPTIGQARDLPITPQITHSIPWRESVAILPSGDPLPVDLSLSVPLVSNDNLALFARPGPVSVLTADDGRGGSQTLFPSVRLDQLPREALFPQKANLWGWILPLVEPPAVGAAPAPQLRDNRLRPYQVDGVRQIVMSRSVLLADDVGLGKTVQACTAVYSLIQRGRARRALVLCSASGLRHWAAHLQSWAPGLLLCVVPPDSDLDAPAWKSRAHVYLTDHGRLVEDAKAGALTQAGLSFDIVVLDDLLDARQIGEDLWAALDDLHASRRLALTGAPPSAEEYWLSVFDFLFPHPEPPESASSLMSAEPPVSPISIVRRTKDVVAAQLPPRTVIELWVDLRGEQREAYHRAIAEERRRLAGLGDAVSPIHIQTAVDRLAHAASYGPITGEGAKIGLLVALLEDVANSGAKALVIANDPRERLEGLFPKLQRFGVVNLDTVEGVPLGDLEVQRFRSDPELHILIGGIDQLVHLASMPELSYVVHVEPHWNPAVRQSVDERVRPRSAPGLPVHVYELWAAATYEARLHDFVLERARYTGGRITLAAELSREDWLERIIELGKAASASGAPLQWTSDAETPSEVTPDKKLVTRLDPSELTEGVTEFVHALGFPDIEQLFGNSQTGVDLLAWREAAGRIERILVRCLTEEGTVGIADARLALDLLGEHPDISRAYLVGTGDFSAAAKKAAEDSEGKLELISGSELARHLRMLGKLADVRPNPAD